MQQTTCSVQQTRCAMQPAPMQEITALYESLIANASGNFPPSRFRIVPLHSSLATDEQKKVFVRPPAGVRKVRAQQRWLLPVACCMLSGACCILSVACCMLLVACYMLYVVCCTLHVACCLLHVVCCLLCVACCTLHVARCMLHAAHIR